MKRLFLILLGSSMSLYGNLQAQDLYLPGVMPTLSVTMPVAKKIDFNFTSFCVFNVTDGKVGTTPYVSQGRLLLVQPSLIYKFSPKLNVSASWAYIAPNPFTPKHGTVFCPWQQVAFNHKVGNGKINHRLRLEELFKEKENLNQYYRATRLRYQLGYQVPLQGKTLDKREFYLNVNHESFVNTSGTFFKPFSENWDYAGVGYVLPDKSKIEVGFMNMAMIRNAKLETITYQSLQLSYIVNLSSGSLLSWWYN